jgi:hypothetical protein
MKHLFTLIILTFFLCQSVFPQEILINEFQSSNSTTIEDSDGDFSDWIEIYSLLDSTINLQGWFLSDDFDDPFKWQFPGKLFPSEELMLIFASGKDTLYPNGELHTSFKLGNGEEPVLLSRPDSTICDYAAIMQINTDWSYGRYPDATADWFFFSEPTPGDFNTTQPFADFADPPEFSHEAGFYENEFYLEIFPTNPGDTVYYTLDGSTPTRNSPMYVEPILMQNRANDPNNLSLIRTTLPGVGFHHWSPPTGVVYKYNVIRARSFSGESYPSKVISSSYVVDSTVNTKFIYPVISLITDSVNFFDDTIGIYKAGYIPDSSSWKYANFAQKGREWERSVHFELFETNGQLGISQNAGVRIHGQGSTSANIKSLRLYARAEYGNDNFNYAFFPEIDQNAYKRIILRNTGNDFSYCYMRDAYMQSLISKMSLDIQAYRLAEVYLNGEYWGIHYIRDRQGKYYLEEKHNLATDQVDIIENNMVIIDGDGLHYDAMIDFISDNDMSDSANYAHVQTLMDCENYIHYAASYFFFSQSDWPYNNTKYWRKRTENYEPERNYGHDGRWRWFVFDTDYGFGRVSNYDYDMFYRVLEEAAGWSPRILQNLVGNSTLPGNENFRNELINTVADLMNANFKTERLLTRIDSMKNDLLPKIEEHMERWNGLKNIPQWNFRINVMIEFAQNRAFHVRQHVINNFSMVTDTANVVLNSDMEQGIIRINKLKINHSTLGLDNPGQPYPWTGIYFAGVPVEVEAIPNPGYVFSHWEGASDATDPIITLDPEGDISLIAHFVPEPVIERELIHYWHFNNLPSGTLTSVAADFSLTGNTSITYPGTGAGYMDSRTHRAQDPVSNLNLHLGQQPNQGAVLRVRNPSDTRELIIQTPTTGFESIEVAFATVRTGNGATEQTFWYSANGGADWTQVDASYSILELPQWQLITYELNVIEELNNNSAVQFKVLFGGENAGGSSGNNRFDNLTIKGVPISEELVFYSKPAGDLTELSVWGNQPDGSGNAPVSFETMNTTYFVQNRTEVALTDDWTVSGVNSKVVLGDGENPTALDVEATMNALLEVSANAELHLKTSSYPEIISLGDGSTVIFSNQATVIPYLNFHHIELHDITPVFEGEGTISISGHLTLTGSVPMPDARDSDEYSWIFSSNSDQTITTNENVLRGYNLQFIKEQGNLTFTQNSFISSDNQMTFNFSPDATFEDNGITIYAGNSVNIGGNADSYNFTGTLILAGTEEGIVKGAGQDNNFNIRQGENTNAVAHFNNIIIRAANTDGEFRFRDGTSNQFVINGDLTIENGADGEIKFYENEIILKGDLIVEIGFEGEFEDIEQLTIIGEQLQTFQLGNRIEIETLILNNPDNLDLQGEIRVETELIFLNGKITGNEGHVVIDDDAFLTGYDENKFISGNLTFRTIAPEAKVLTYPIGTNNIYLPAELQIAHTDSAESAYALRADFFDSPGGLLSSELDYLVEEYMYPFVVAGDAEITQAQLTLPFNPATIGFDLSLLRMALLVNGGWVNLGGNISGNNISSTVNYSESGIFALAKASETTPSDELVHFWLFDTALVNDTPLQAITARYSYLESGQLNFQSALAGYPFDPEHPLWRKASMERRNAPTPINYRPEGNNGIPYPEAEVRGMQIKQPFTGDGGQNTLTFNLPSTGFNNLKYSFAAKDEGAADLMLVEYSVISGTPVWTTSGMESSILILEDEYNFYELDFTEIQTASNNPNFKIRIQFDGSNMEEDDDKRVSFNNFALSGESIESYFQIVDLSQGWSGISSFIQPENSQIENVFAVIQDQLAIVQNNDGLYWPAMGINTLINWDTQTGYAVKMINASQLIISGNLIENPMLQLSQGWSYLPVLNNCVFDLDELLSEVSNNIWMVKEVAGVGVYWPQFGINTLGYVEPGQAYYIMANESVEIDFTNCNLKASAADSKLIYSNPQRIEPPINSGWGTYSETSKTHLVAIPESSSPFFENGDYIGAFDGFGNCFGIARWEGKSTALILFGNDPSTSEKDGFDDGEALHFSTFKPDENFETDLYVDFDNALPQNQKVFETNGISALKSAGVASENQAQENDISIFPNPTNESFKINIRRISDIETINLDVFTIEGVKILEALIVDNPTEIETAFWKPGIYILKFRLNNHQVVKRMIKR